MIAHPGDVVTAGVLHQRGVATDLALLHAETVGMTEIVAIVLAVIVMKDEDLLVIETVLHETDLHVTAPGIDRHAEAHTTGALMIPEAAHHDVTETLHHVIGLPAIGLPTIGLPAIVLLTVHCHVALRALMISTAHRAEHVQFHHIHRKVDHLLMPGPKIGQIAGLFLPKAVRRLQNHHVLGK